MRCSAGYSEPSSTRSRSAETRWMCAVIAYPCHGLPSASVLSTSRTSVPWRMSFLRRVTCSPVMPNGEARGLRRASTAASLDDRLRVAPFPIDRPGGAWARPAISGACARSQERSRPASVPGLALASAWRWPAISGRVVRRSRRQRLEFPRARPCPSASSRSAATDTTADSRGPRRPRQSSHATPCRPGDSRAVA